MNFFKALFKREKANKNTIHDPDFEGFVEEAFKFESTKYYTFKKDSDTPYGRYKWVSTFLQEVELRMTLPTLNAYLDDIEKNISGGKGAINLTNVALTINKMRTRTALHFDVETAKKLASVIYFDETEDLTTYDREKGRAKIAAWSTDTKVMDFFLTKPMRELLGLNDISTTALTDYISQQVEIIKALTSETPEAS